jgi:hypothetical protein
MRDEFQGWVIVQHQVSYACWDVHAIAALETVGSTLDKNARLPLKNGNCFAEAMRVIRQKCSGLESRDAGAEARSATSSRDKDLKIDSWRRTGLDFPGACRYERFSNCTGILNQDRLRQK